MNEEIKPRRYADNMDVCPGHECPLWRYAECSHEEYTYGTLCYHAVKKELSELREFKRNAEEVYRKKIFNIKSNIDSMEKGIVSDLDRPPLESAQELLRKKETEAAELGISLEGEE